MRSLSFIVSVRAVFAVSVSMGIYAIFEYFYMPGATVPELLMHHLAHVLALGAAIYLVCLWVLHRIMARPLQAIRLHLLRVGIGKLERLAVDTDILEVRSVVDGINDMIERMRMAEGVSTGRARGRIEWTKQLVVVAQRRAEEVERISRHLGARNHRFGSSMQARLVELRKTLAWIFLKV